MNRLWHVQFYIEPDHIAGEEYVIAGSASGAAIIVEKHYALTEIDVVSVSLRAERVLENRDEGLCD